MKMKEIGQREGARIPSAPSCGSANVIAEQSEVSALPAGCERPLPLDTIGN